jgi:hypothetical protein
MNKKKKNRLKYSWMNKNLNLNYMKAILFYKTKDRV